ncbi:MAG: ATP-dependent DNA helicase Rep [Anaerolineales bacterium]|nr:ATP-dependent DNA helicase Rep [Anaerolineales bacterium]
MDFLDKLNQQQKQAVTARNGPVLVLAGPGSGKTRVLTQRVAYLIASEGVRPYQILAVTFTNKAAREMEHRVQSLLGEEATQGMMLGTFHSICARLLRRESEHLPLESNFVIFDSDDQERIVKSIIREFNLDEKRYRPASVHASISKAKNDLIGADDYPITNYRDEVVKRVYIEYQKRLIASNAVDFDDLLVYTARLLEDNPSVREKYARRFVHVLVDEFQDTNIAQYTLVKHLSSAHGNIFCVGDPDQCFPSGTKVHTPNGPTAIENIKVGDVVFAASGLGSTTASRVTHAGKRYFNGDLVKVATKSGNTFAVTPNHIIFAAPAKKRLRAIASSWLKPESSGLKPPSQFMEAFQAGATESGLPDFHALRRGIHPPAVTTDSNALHTAPQDSSCAFQLKDDMDMAVLDSGAFLVTNPARDFSLLPASALRPSMIAAIEKDGTIIEDVIIEVRREAYSGLVYDFEVENLHNYIAGGIVVHNSIYRWRGADWRNVQRFEQDFPDAQVILLEQNYRSRQNILDAAMSVIDRAQHRRKKKLFTERGAGEKIFFYEAPDDYAEASFVVDTIAQLVASRQHEPGDCAVMYRANAMSRLLEEAFLAARLPYRLVGAQRFYGRKEVKDMIAFLRLVHNPSDEASLDRIINVPPRGIGDKTLTTLHVAARQAGVTPGSVLLDLARGSDSPFWNQFSGRSVISLADFGASLANWKAASPSLTVPELFDRIASDLNYKDYIDDQSEEGKDRWENVQELKRLAQEYSTRTLDEFLENVALVSDQDTLTDGNVPTLLTLHAAKGLEFGAVFIVGLDDGILPHSRSFDEPEAMEEERRLFYVGITRAKDRLYLLRAVQRGGRGYNEEQLPSRYLDDLPAELLQGRSRTGRSLRGPATSLRTSRAPEETTWPRPHPLSRQEGRAAPVVEQKYRAGTRVKHPTWGEGIVLDSRVDGEDELVDVVFESVGIKRLAASLANLKII